MHAEADRREASCWTGVMRALLAELALEVGGGGP